MTEGVSTALAQVLDGQAEPDLLEQAGLFADLDAAEIGALDAPSPLSPTVQNPLADAVRRRGRPPGSRNRRTDATVRWLLTQHRHPLAVMAEAYSMSPRDLAERIGLQPLTRPLQEQDGQDDKGRPKWRARLDADGRELVEVVTDADGRAVYGGDVLMEVVKLQLRMAEAVAPYVAQRLPQAVEVQARHDFTMQVLGVSLPARAPGAENPGQVEGQFSVVLPGKSDD